MRTLKSEKITNLPACACISNHAETKCLELSISQPIRLSKHLQRKKTACVSKLQIPLLNNLWFAHPFRPSHPRGAPCSSDPSVGYVLKGQVTRAQEAEENYLVVRELATVRQQSEEATAQLELAQSTIRELQQRPLLVRSSTVLMFLYGSVDLVWRWQFQGSHSYTTNVCTVSCFKAPAQWHILQCHLWEGWPSAQAWSTLHPSGSDQWSGLHVWLRHRILRLLKCLLMWCNYFGLLMFTI